MNILLTAFVLIAAGALALLATGCTSNRPFRTDSTLCNPGQPGADCSKAIIESTPDYKLGFVEFDDQGWFWDTNQVKDVEQMIQINHTARKVVGMYAGWRACRPPPTCALDSISKIVLKIHKYTEL